MLSSGNKVRFLRDVDRYPHFKITAGATGEVVSATDERIAVRLDDPTDGAEEWDNQVIWYAEHHDLESVEGGQIEVVS